MDVIGRNLAKIADKAKYLSEPAWTPEGCTIVGKQIHGWAVEAMEALTTTQGAVGALHEAIKLARDFNRGAMTWQEYDRKLATLASQHPRGR